MVRYFLLFFLILCACHPSVKDEPDATADDAIWDHQFEMQGLSFRGISVVSGTIAWVSGNHGSVVMTTDGGAHWTLDTLAGYEEFDFRDIETFGPDTVLVMSAGSPGVILRTTDGGRQWQEVYFDARPEIFMNSMSFFNARHGLIVGDPMNGRIFLMETWDGGVTWAELPDQQKPVPEEGEYLFAASGNCLLTWGSSSAAFATGGRRARVWRTDNAGLHWQPIETPMKSGMPTFGIYAIYRSDSNCFCVGGDYTDPENRRGTFCYAFGGCNDWHIPEVQPFGFRSCIKVMRAKEHEILVATGMNGTDISINRGSSWHRIDTLGFHTMDVDPSGQVLFAAGSGGRISKLFFKEK